jgi:hypothetical protein
MQTPLLVILAVAVVGATYVVLPVVAETYRRFRDTRRPVCPETGMPAEVMLNARHAAVTAAFGKPDLQVSGCSRWPEHHGCDQGCTKGIDQPGASAP